PRRHGRCRRKSGRHARSCRSTPRRHSHRPRRLCSIQNRQSKTCPPKLPRRRIENPPMPWHRKHLLTLEELSLAEIQQIHTVAAAFKRTLSRRVKKVPALRGKTIVNLFLEPSTRPRLSFDMAAKFLSAEVITFDAASSSATKGETLRDTAQNIQ